MRRLQAVVLFAVFACPSAAHATTEDTRAKTRTDPVVATPEVAKAQLYSGGLGYTYKIDLPPAAGITPDLQLSYSSLTKSTEYGRGWSLNLSKIERSTRFGPPTYEVPDSGIDEFEIDGSLLVKDPNIPDRFHLEQVDHRRILYIPGSDSWEVTNPDGTKFLYGARPEANSKLRNDGRPDLPQATFRWSLDKVRDPRGNYYEVDYAYETFLHPQSEDGSPPPIEYNMNNHPDVIRYSFWECPVTDCGAAGESPSRKRRIVDFQWEMRGEQDWNDDLPTSYRSGFKIQISERLSDIIVGTDENDDGQVASSERIRRYQFVYTEKPTSNDLGTYDNPVFSQLEGIQRYGKTDADKFPKATDFAYKPITRGHVFGQSSVPMEWELPTGPGIDWKYPGSIISDKGYAFDARFFGSSKISTLVDLNGDGFTDFVALIGNAPIDDYPNLPPGGLEWWIAYGPLRPGGSLEAALNGEPNQWGFGTPERWKWRVNGVEGDNGPGYTINAEPPYDIYFGGVISRNDQTGTAADLVDVNGDGLLDYVIEGVTFLNLGDSACSDQGNPVGCFEQTALRGPPKIEDVKLEGVFSQLDKILGTLADVNGDGLPDYVEAYIGNGNDTPDLTKNWAQVRFNDDGEFSEVAEFAPLSDMDPNSDDNHIGLRVGGGFGPGLTIGTSQMFADMNGDGMADRNGWNTCLRTPVHSFSLGSGWQSLTEGTGQWFWDDRAVEDLPYNFCQPAAYFDGIQPEVRTWSAQKTIGALVDLNGDGIVDYYHRDATVAPGPGDFLEAGVYFGLGDGSYLTVDDQLVDDLYKVPWGIPWALPGPFDADRAIRDYRYEGLLTQMILEFIDMNGDGLPDLVYNPHYDQNYGGGAVPFLDVWLHPGPSGLLESVTNELGGVTSFEYESSSVFRDKEPVATTGSEGGIEQNLPAGVRMSAPQWVLTKITTKDGRTGTPDQSQAIEYADLLYDYDLREYIGARMAESTDAAAVLTRQFFHQSKELRPRLEFTETEDENEIIVRTEKTEWTAAQAKNESGTDIPGAWFPKPLKTITTLIDSGGTASKIVSRSFDDKTGNLVTQRDFGPDGLLGTADDHLEYFLQFSQPNFTDWLLSYPLGTLEGGVGGPVVVFYYDDSTDPLAVPTQGLLTKRASTQTRMSEHGTNASIVEQWSYDEFGNQTAYFDGRAMAAVPPPTVTRATEYDTKFEVFPVKITNALLHVTEFAFDTDFGEVSKVLDPNGYLQCWEYDTFGRLDTLKERAVSGAVSKPCTSTLANFSFPLMGIDPSQQHILATRFPGGGAPGIRSRSFIDGLGRVYQEEGERKTNEFAITVRSWGSRGELACEALPVLDLVGGGSALPECGSGLEPVLTTTYDALLRPLDTTRTGNVIPEIERSYSIEDLDSNGTIELVETRKINANPSPLRETKTGTDPNGRIVAVVETGGGLTRLQRDPRGRIIIVDGPIANDSLSITYNDQDQRMSLSGWWGAGNWSYDYDTNGNLTEKISPAVKMIKFHWDKLDRLAVKDYGPDFITDIINANPLQDIIYTYDTALKGIGRLAAVTTPDMTAVDTNFAYDYKGRVKGRTRNFGASGAFPFSYAYDELDRRKSVTLPNGNTILHDYNGSVLQKIHSNGNVTIADNVVLHESGAITEIDYQLFSQEDGASYTYWPNTYRLKKATGTANGNTVQDLDFDYDLAGNLTSVNQGTGEFGQTFSYDALHRIKTAVGQTPAYTSLTYEYDAAGNLKEKGPTNAPLYLFYESTNAGPHAVSRVENDAGALLATYAYDDDGALEMRDKDGVLNLERDDDGRIWQLTGATGATYVYDESGQRTRKTAPGIDTLYVDKEYEVDISDPPNPKHKVHYFHGSRRIATENRSRAGLPGDEGVTQSWQYYFPDFVGSNSVVVRGTDVNKSFFTPFGEFTQVGEGLTDYLFTGQENDPESGLMYYGARYYDPWVGRFCSQDPALVGPAGGASFAGIAGDPRNFNAYTYALNAPTRYTDPSGRTAKSARWGPGWQAARGKGYVISYRNPGGANKRNSKKEGGDGESPAAAATGAPQGVQVANAADYVDAIKDTAQQVKDAVVPDLDAARRIANEEIAKRPSGHNDLEDAMRHAEASRRVVEEVNTPSALIMGYGHEAENLAEGSPIKGVLMDLHNNAVGRAAGAAGRPVDPSELITDPSDALSEY